MKGYDTWKLASPHDTPEAKAFTRHVETCDNCRALEVDVDLTEHIKAIRVGKCYRNFLKEQ